MNPGLKVGTAIVTVGFTAALNERSHPGECTFRLASCFPRERICTLSVTGMQALD
jgi:hypothetical protein